MFIHGIISLINKPTRFNKDITTAIDNIFTNKYFNTNLKTGVIKTEVSGFRSYHKGPFSKKKPKKNSLILK